MRKYFIVLIHVLNKLWPLSLRGAKRSLRKQGSNLNCKNIFLSLFRLLRSLRSLAMTDYFKILKEYVLILLVCAKSLNGSFLRTDDTALSFGLGSAGTSYINDSSSILINPANTINVNNINIAFSQYLGPESITGSYFGIVKQIGNEVNIGFVGKGLYPLDKIKLLDDRGETTGEEALFLNYLIGLNLSVKLITILQGNVFGGINIKYINESLWDYPSYGIAGDAGILYSSQKIRDLKFGISYQNLGKIMQDYLNGNNYYPNIFRIGMSFSDNILMNQWDQKRNLFFILDVILANHNEADYFCFGMEYYLKKIISIKVGYRLRIGSGFQDTDYLRNLRAGLGLKLKNIMIDYSLSPKSNESNQFLNMISIVLNF